MKKLLLIAALIAALIIPSFSWAAELNNVTAQGVDGNLNFYDVNMNIICTWDAANRKFTIPSGSTLNVPGTTSFAAVIASGDISGNTVHASTITASGDVSGNSVHGSSVTASGPVAGSKVTASGDVSGNSVHGSTITASGDVSGNSIHGSSITSSGDVSGNTIHGSTITASGDVSGNSIHGSTATFSSITANKVVLTSTGGLLVSSTMTDASFNALAPVYVEVSGSYTLTSTQMQSPKCTIVNVGSGSDASYNLPVDISGNLACDFQSGFTSAQKWGVHSTTINLAIADASGATLGAAGDYARFDQSVAGQSFQCKSQKTGLTTWGWVCKPTVTTVGRAFANN